MSDVDRAIRQSLSAEDAELFDRLSLDQSLRRQVLATFEGQLKWMNVAGWIAGFVLFGVAALMAWQFVQAPNVEDMLRWAAGAALAFAGLALVKVWFWMEMQKNAIMREVKRLELQVAALAAQARRP
jgi:cytochrome c biogenesis protein CcdA